MQQITMSKNINKHQHNQHEDLLMKWEPFEHIKIKLLRDSQT